MNYAASISYLNSFLNLERMVFSPDNRTWNLRRIKILLEWSGHPEKDFFPVLIAGTKGKGSTGFFLESILKSNRISNGFYHSPHLMDPRERIRINGRLISRRHWTEGLDKIRGILRKNRLPDSLGDLTYFEIMTLLAILEFQRMKVQVGIFEIGMGGRLDAANSMDAKVAVLTSIDFDHEAFLGNTIAAIAREKAAIIRPGAHIVVTPQRSPAAKVVQSTIRKMMARRWEPWPPNRFGRLALEGEHQKANAGAALRAAWLMSRFYGFPYNRKASLGALAKGKWPGRLEKVSGKPSILFDVAHNPASVKALVSYLRRHYNNKKAVLIFGCSRDKKSVVMLRIFSSFFKEIIVTRAGNSRSQEAPVLAAQARPYFEKIYLASTVRESLKLVSPDTLAVCAGSFYLVGELMNIKRKT